MTNDYLSALQAYLNPQNNQLNPATPYPMSMAPASPIAMPVQDPFEVDGMQTSAGYVMPGMDQAAANPGLFASLQGWMKDSGFLTSKDDKTGLTTQGWGGMATGALQGLGNAYMGMKQFDLAKQQLAEGKRQFEMNYGAQRQTVNTHLEDRQLARVASNPGAYQSVGDYMAKNGVK